MTDNLNGWRAGVYGEDMVAEGIRLVVGQRHGNVRQYVTSITDGFPQMQVVEPGRADVPTLSIPLDMARALLDALSAHFGGSGAGRELRGDYLHERGRVDNLIQTLSTIATGDGAT